MEMLRELESRILEQLNDVHAIQNKLLKTKLLRDEGVAVEGSRKASGNSFMLDDKNFETFQHKEPETVSKSTTKRKKSEFRRSEKIDVRNVLYNSNLSDKENQGDNNDRKKVQKEGMFKPSVHLLSNYNSCKPSYQSEHVVLAEPPRGPSSKKIQEKEKKKCMSEVKDKKERKSPHIVEHKRVPVVPKCEAPKAPKRSQSITKDSNKKLQKTIAMQTPSKPKKTFEEPRHAIEPTNSEAATPGRSSVKKVAAEEYSFRPRLSTKSLMIAKRLVL